MARVRLHLAPDVLDVSIDRPLVGLQRLAVDGIQQWDRVKTRPGWRAMVASSSNSVAVRAARSPATVASRRGTSSVSSPTVICSSLASRA